MSALREIYDSLKGSRANLSGQLTITGFTAQDYEDLYDYVVSEVIASRLTDGVDFFHWLRLKALALHHHRSKNRFYDDKPDPLIDTPPEELDTRQQLSILKFYIYRRVYSHIQME